MHRVVPILILVLTLVAIAWTARGLDSAHRGGRGRAR